MGFESCMQAYKFDRMVLIVHVPGKVIIVPEDWKFLLVNGFKFRIELNCYIKKHNLSDFLERFVESISLIKI